MSIATERAALFAQGLEIVSREKWGAQQSYLSPRPVERARWLFLHIAVVDDPNDLVGTEHQVMRNIERIGQIRFGIGGSYNAAAFDTGHLYELQPLQRRGAHTVNDKPNRAFPYHADGRGYSLNHLARALVLPQQVDDDVTDEQIDSAARWGAAVIRSGFANPGAVWFGHRDVTQKSCPGPIGYGRLDELNRLTRRYEAFGLTEIPDMDANDKAIAAKTLKLLEALVPDASLPLIDPATGQPSSSGKPTALVWRWLRQLVTAEHPDAAAIAAAIPDDIAEQVATELANRLSS